MHTKKNLVGTTYCADCPSCKARATFIYLGEQIFPEHIVKALSNPVVIHLLNCSNCHSTLSHTGLKLNI